MAGSSENPKKDSKKRTVFLLVTGLFACAAGVFIGRGFTTPAPSPESDSPPDVSDSTQPAGIDEVKNAFGQAPFVADAQPGLTEPESVAAQNETQQPETDVAEIAVDEIAAAGHATNTLVENPVEADVADTWRDDVDADIPREVQAPISQPSEAAAKPVDSTQMPFQVTSRERHVTLADEELRSGNYDRAIRIYSAVLEGASGVQEASIRFRLALTMEALGEYQSAKTHYQSLIADFPELSWSTAARLGEARCAAALGQVDVMVSKILRFILLDEGQVGQRVRGEFMHIAGRAIGHALLEDSSDRLLDVDMMFLPTWLIDPNRELNFLRTVLKEEPSFRKSKDGFTIVQQSDRLPGDTFVQAITGKSDLRMLLNAICRRSGFELTISKAASERLTGRTQHLRVSDISISLLLDGMCTPFGLLWTQDEKGIHIQAHDEVSPDVVDKYQQDFAVRLLKTAMVVAPDSNRVSHSRMALGVLQHRAGQTIEAAYTFKTQLSGNLPAGLYAEAALNLGKCRLALGQFDQAEESFLLAVDSGSKNVRASTAAYLFYSRMLIESGKYQRAVSSLYRALSLCRGTEFEATTALMLASAYLMNGSPQGASDVLMKRREDLRGDSVQPTAAFLSALAQFRATVLPGPRERAARSLVTALSRFDPLTEFGAHWSYLRAEACDEVGLTKDAMASFSETIQRQPAAQMRGRAMLKLSNHYRFEGRLAEASDLLNVVSGESKEEFGRQIAMQAALVALKRGHPEVAIEQCRYIVESEDDPGLQRTALQTMGQAYEKMNDYKSAVYCFAGMLPAAKKPKAVDGTPVLKDVEQAEDDEPSNRRGSLR